MKAPPTAGFRPTARTVAALLLMGFLGSMGTLRADLLPDLLSGLWPPLQRQLLSLGMFTLLATAIALLRRSPWPRGPSLRTPLLVGLGLFVVPGILSQLAAGTVSPVTRAALLPLAPVFAVVFEPYLADNPAGQSRRALLAAIASASGTLLVLPITMPDSLQVTLAWLALGSAAACVGATSCVSFRATTRFVEDSGARLEASIAIAPFAAVSGAVAFIGLAGFAVTQSNPIHWEALPSTLLWTGITELPALCLLFWLIPRLPAPRITTRFTLTLLFPVFLGAVLVGSHLSLRDWGGVALMASGTAYLLLAPEDRPDGAGLSLR